jgi:hypothetical protein
VHFAGIFARNECLNTLKQFNFKEQDFFEVFCMVLEGIKDFYYSIEEKWYGALDKIDAKIPIYGVIDAIDSVVPSLILFTLLVILILAFGLYGLLSLNQTYSATFTIYSPGHKVVNDTLIEAKVIQNGNEVKTLSGRTDSDGVIKFTDITGGQELFFDINISKGTYRGSFPVVGDFEDTITLLAPAIIFEPVVKKVFVRSQTGLTVTDSIPLTFSCANSSLLPDPQSATFTGTEIRVTEPVNCNLMANFAGNAKYLPKSYKIDALMKDIYLEKPDQPATILTVKIRFNGYPVNDSSFKIRLSGDNTYEGTTGSSSQAQINVEPGNYFLTATDTTGKYGIVSKSITVQGTMETQVDVSKTIKARVSVLVLDERTDDPIVDAVVNVKTANGVEMTTLQTDSSGYALLTFTDQGDYIIAAKKPTDLNGGYFAKEVKQTITSDTNLTIQLEKITNANAGKTTVKVVDQDGLTVINARVMLKYKDNDGIVELLQAKNYAVTDINGEATFIAGKVDGLVYAYAVKGPFNGFSAAKQILIDQKNTFNIQIQIGSATIKIKASAESGDEIEGSAEILTLDGKTVDAHGVAGIISVEKGEATRQVKAGQTVYIKLKADGYKEYITLPVELWPTKTYTFDVTMLKAILEPGIKFGGLYNESGASIQTMAPGKKYYAKFSINSDQAYEETIFHFRAGTENLMDNDVVEIDSVEAANIYSQTKGISYDENRGYEYDSNNTTDGSAKWVNTLFTNTNEGVREVKVWFRLKKTATPNKEIQFYYRAKFDDTRVPASSAQQDFYADTYSTIIYYVGTESSCNADEKFCVNSEWFYSIKDDLYGETPYSLNQLVKYKYHFNLFNNSGIDYGSTGNEKPVYLSIKVVGDASEEKRIKINGYEIKDATTRKTNETPMYSVNNIPISAFEKNTAIDTLLVIEGLKEGSDEIYFELKSEGERIYSKTTSFSIVKEDEFTVDVSPTFIPALMNTEMEINVKDEKGDYLPGAIVNSYAKEPGFDEYLVDSKGTDRLGKAVVNSGALFQGSKVIIEVLKEGYSRKRYQITVSSDVIVTDPSELSVELNTYSQREVTKSVTFANQTTYDLLLKSITMDADLEDVINEDAMNGFFTEISEENRIIKAEDTLDLELLKLKLMTNITQASLEEPISIRGTVKMVFEQEDTHLIFENDLPITINVSSEANPGADCLVVSASKTSAVTQLGQVSFDLTITNSCESDGSAIPLESFSVQSDSDISGTAEISVRNAAGLSVGRTALDSSKRILLSSVKAGEKLYAVVTYAPDESVVGKAIELKPKFYAKFNGSTIGSTPSTKLTVNVVNLKECLSITHEDTAVAFDSESKITIDSSNCLGQKIDVILCKNDSKCAGGTPYGVILSSKSFTLQNQSKDIIVYGPTIAGEYGVSVHARTRGSTGFTYIGEVPVKFKERTSQYFRLNKFDLTLVGEGSVDSVMLTNKMLTTDVKVKANACIWGKKDGSFSWSNALTGALMGAMIGSMLATSISGSGNAEQGSKIGKASNTGSNSTGGIGNKILERDSTGAPSVAGTLGYTGDAKQTNPTYSFSNSLNFDSPPPILHFAGLDQPVSQPVKEAHFEWKGFGVGSGGTMLKWGTTLVFALLAAFLMGESTYKCADDWPDPVTYTDFVILLQGTTVSVTPPAGSSSSDTSDEDVPSDAGDLSFSLTDTNGHTVIPTWNFSDASYSSQETVGIDFNNTGINEERPSYGVLTINATMHLHGGRIPTLSSDEETTTSSTSTYDVLCKSATFGNYWIGSGSDEGSCSGITTKNYSQKYHMRIVTSEATGEDSYIKKSSSCYFGSLTGSTGEEAVPKRLLNWDWGNIKSDTCDYGNEDYVYCDGTQFMIALTKKLANIDEFLEHNDTKFICPPNPLEKEVTTTMNEVNSQTESVASGYIGVERITLEVGDTTTAHVTVNNRTGADATSNISIAWAGNGGVSADNTDTQTKVFPQGETIIDFTASTPKYDGFYYFSAVVNGSKGNSKIVKRAFTYREVNNNCWLTQTTQKIAGFPGLIYYVDALSDPYYTTAIPDESSVYDAINFGVYLTKDAFTEDFLSDFKSYYRNTLLQGVNVNTTQANIVDYLTSGNFKIIKKYSGDNEIEPGLYDVWINIDAPERFRVIDGNKTTIKVTLLLVKSPSVDSPFYSMPFDGLVGQQGGRQGYGTTYTNNDTKNITLTSSGTPVTTYYNAASNGVMGITTYTKTSFESANASVSTRGQIASASVNNGIGTLVLTPTYATPVIAKYILNDSSGKMTYALESISSTTTGGNMAYWTGAAKSKDFYNSNAVETYSDSPDNHLTKIGDNIYGFEFDDVTRKGTMYLKSYFFVPSGSDTYRLTVEDSNTLFWTPNTVFSSSIELSGIDGMVYNSKRDDSYISSIQDLFDAVKEQKVCVSNDGSTSTFWWNPKTIQNTTGVSDSLATKETSLIGTN